MLVLTTKQQKDILINIVLIKYSIYKEYSDLNFNFFFWLSSKKEHLHLFSSFFYFILFKKSKFSKALLVEKAIKKEFEFKTSFSSYSLVFYSFLTWMWPYFKFRYSLKFDYSLQTTFFSLRTKFPFIFLIEKLFSVKVKITSPLPMTLTIKTTNSFLIQERIGLFILSFYKTF